MFGSLVTSNNYEDVKSTIERQGRVLARDTTTFTLLTPKRMCHGIDSSERLAEQDCRWSAAYQISPPIAREHLLD